MSATNWTPRTGLSPVSRFTFVGRSGEATPAPVATGLIPRRPHRKIPVRGGPDAVRAWAACVSRGQYPGPPTPSGECDRQVFGHIGVNAHFRANSNGPAGTLPVTLPTQM